LRTEKPLDMQDPGNDKAREARAGPLV